MTTRDWAWPWAPGWGPLTLTLRVNQPLETIRAFVQPLVDAAPWHTFRAANGTPEPNAWRSDPELERDCRFFLDDGLLGLLRSYTDVHPGILAFEAALLTRLGQGALGPLAWDAIDDEYVEPIAGGDDADSLLLHLSSAAPEAELRAHYQAYYRPLVLDLYDVDPLPALTEALGAPPFDEPLPFSEWLKTAVLSTRRLTVRAPPDVVPWVSKLLQHAPRLMVTLQG